MLSASVAKIVGSASETSWSQVHTFKAASDKLTTYGSLILIVSLNSAEAEEGVELSTAGKEVIQRIHELYYGQEMSGSSLEHLSEVLEKVGKEFEELTPNIIAAVFVPGKKEEARGVLYLTWMGKAAAVLMRKGKIFKLTSEAKKESGDTKPLSMSGYVYEGDQFIFGTDGFFETVSLKEIIDSMKLNDPEEVSLALAPLVHELSDNSKVAAVVTRLRKEKETELLMSESDLDSKEEEIENPSYSESDSELKIKKLKVGRITKGLKRFVKPFLKARIKGGEIKVKSEENKRSKLMFSVAFVVLMILLVSVFFGWRHRVGKEREERFLTVWEVVEHQYSEAISLLELNPLRARSLLSEAKKLINEAIDNQENEFDKNQREQLTKKLDEVLRTLEQVSGEHKLENADVFMDLNLVRSDTIGEVMALYENTLVVLDRNAGVLLKIEINTKSSDTVGGGALLAGSSQVAVTSGRGFVLSDSGVVEVSLEGKTSAVAVETDAEWGKIADVEAFAGNLYLLDRVQGEIFRYQGGESGFGARRRWLGQGVFPDFSEAVAMTIDGDIWVLKEDSILRFRRGVPEAYSISGLEKKFSKVGSIYTDADSDYLYVLDRGNGRVLVIKKTGEYEKQYIWEGIGGSTDLVVSEKEGKILLLSGSTIYKIMLDN